MLRFAVITNIILTFLMLIVGSFVNSQSAGMECLNWPICYQQSGAVNLSQAMFHRIIAGVILVLNIYLVFFNKKINAVVKKYLRLGLFILIIQSLIGALSVYFQFPSIIKVAHLLLSIIYIVLFSMALFPNPIQAKPLKHYNPHIKDVVFLLIVSVFLQFFFGSIIKHSSASNICGLGEMTSFICNEIGVGASWWPTSVAAKINSLHRYNAVAFVCLFLIFIYQVIRYQLFRAGEFSGQIKFLVVTLSTIVISHLFLANKLLVSNLAAILRALHLLYAAFILIGLYGVLDWLKKYEQKAFGVIKHSTLQDMIELTKPRLGALVVVTVISGILLSGQFVDFFYLVNALVLTTMIIAAATTLNCYMEVEVDSKMERTKDRALPSGRLSKKIALVQGLVLILVSIPLTIIYVNWDTAILGFMAFALYLFAYTPLKQKSPLALYVGAIPGAIPPVMGRTIVVGEIDAMGWILFAVLFIWQLPHFMAISIYHNDDYKAGGIKVYSHSLSPMVLKALIALLTIALCIVSILPYYYTNAPKLYLYVSLAIGLIFVAHSLLGFIFSEKRKYISWARQYFWASIIYLPLLMAAMIFLS